MTAIEWTDETWNPVVGCTEVSPGCAHCYAAVMAVRLAAMGQSVYEGLAVKTAQGAKWTGTVRPQPAVLEKPFRWRKPRKIFVGSMTDVFHPNVTDKQLSEVFSIAHRAFWHTFQFLTKRAERMREYSNAFVRDLNWPYRNVWMGASAEDQQRLDERYVDLVNTRSSCRFLSCEPLLGPLTLDPNAGQLIDWVIVGGESGAGARPFHAEWADDLVMQCREAEIPVFVKQLGSNAHWAGERWKMKSRHGTDPTEWPRRMLWRREFPPLWIEWN